MLDGLKTALASTNLSFALFAWSHAPNTDYGVISLDQQAEMSADSDAGAETMLEGFVDYFARSYALTAKESIETALRGLGLWWTLNSVQFEEDTGYVHYEWRWKNTNGSV